MDEWKNVTGQSSSKEVIQCSSLERMDDKAETDAVRSFSVLLTTMEDTSCDCGKDASLFQKGQNIGLDKANKRTEGIAESTNMGIKIVQNLE